MPHSAVSKLQRKRAKTLRLSMTRAETLLWRYLKAHHIDGLGFRRQVPIRGYVADFVCHGARLVVELDGETHDNEQRLRLDGRRDAWFASQGYHVLRFTNAQVLKELEGVVTVIRETAAARIRGAPPSLSLPHKGGGNPHTSALQVTETLSPPLPQHKGVHARLRRAMRGREQTELGGPAAAGGESAP